MWNTCHTGKDSDCSVLTLIFWYICGSIFLLHHKYTTTAWSLREANWSEFDNNSLFDTKLLRDLSSLNWFDSFFITEWEKTYWCDFKIYWPLFSNSPEVKLLLVWWEFLLLYAVLIVMTCSIIVIIREVTNINVWQHFLSLKELFPIWLLVILSTQTVITTQLSENRRSLLGYPYIVITRVFRCN